MLVVGQRIDRGDPRELGKIDNILLGEGADDRPMHHATENAGRVLDRFAATELDVVFREKHRESTELANADFKRNARPRRRLGENQRPGLTRQRLAFAATLKF